MERNWNSIMFDDVGIKIQKNAKVIAWVNIVTSIIGGIAMFFCAFINIEDLWWLILLSPLMVALGCMVAWLSTITLYGFGKLIDDVEAIRYKKTQVIGVETKQNNQPYSKPLHPTVEKVNLQNISTNPDILPKKEQKEELQSTLICPQCSENLAFMGWTDIDLQEKQRCPFCGKEITFDKQLEQER